LAEDSYKQRKPANKDGNSDSRSEGASHSGRSGSRSNNDGYKPREGGYRPREGGQGGYKPREGGQGGQGGYRSREGGQGGYKPREGGQGGYRPREGGSGPREGGYKPREGGQGGQGGYRSREGGQGGYRPREGGSGPREGGYKPREGGQGGQGGYRSREGGQGGYRPREGGSAPAKSYPDEAPRAPTDEERGLGKDTGEDRIGVRVGARRSEDYTRSYRGSSVRATSNQRAKGPNSNRKGKPTTREAVRKQPMLSMHKIQPFKYDMNEILNETSMDPAKASAFLATVVAKASRISLKEAKEYIAEVVEAGDLTKDEQTRFNNLLQKYSKYR